ncbi:hypothetical protein QR98_0032670 [Sarcoptes scabiei]|nr:hypothetical protein QR98_0032670 [Sarcoptes scabiei]
MSLPEFKRSLSTNSYPANDGGRSYLDKYQPSRRRAMTLVNDERDSNDDQFLPIRSSDHHFRSPFQRSNSISGPEPNFGGIIKRSIGQLFNAATVNTSLATATIQKSVPKVKCVSSMGSSKKNGNDRNEHIKDHMVSFLCESAIR